MVTFQGTQPQTLLAPAICAAPAPARSRPVAPLFGFGPPPPPAARRPRGAQRVRARPRGAPCRPARRRRGGAWLRRAGPRGRTSSRRLLGPGPPPQATRRRRRRGGRSPGLSRAARVRGAGLRPPGRRTAKPAAPRAVRGSSLQPELRGWDPRRLGVKRIAPLAHAGRSHAPPGRGASVPGSDADQVARELRLSARSADSRGPEAARRRAEEARGEGAWSAGRGDARRRRRAEEARGDPGPRRPRPPRPPQSRPRRSAASLCASASGSARPRLRERVPTPPAGPGSRHPPSPPLNLESEPPTRPARLTCQPTSLEPDWRPGL